MDRGPLVIIPPRQIKQVYSTPENALDVVESQDQTLAARYTMWDRFIIKERLHVNVIRNQLNRNLTSITPFIAEEIAFGFSRMWGDSSDWRDVKVWDTALRIIAGAANGAFCGKPLCEFTTFFLKKKKKISKFIGSLWTP